MPLELCYSPLEWCMYMRAVADRHEQLAMKHHRRQAAGRQPPPPHLARQNSPRRGYYVNHGDFAVVWLYLCAWRVCGVFVAYAIILIIIDR